MLSCQRYWRMPCHPRPLARFVEVRARRYPTSRWEVSTATNNIEEERTSRSIEHCPYRQLVTTNIQKSASISRADRDNILLCLLQVVFALRSSISEALDEEPKTREFIDGFIGGVRGGESMATLFRMLPSPEHRQWLVRLSSLLLESKSPFAVTDSLSIVESSPDHSETSQKGGKRQRVKKRTDTGELLGVVLHSSALECLLQWGRKERVILSIRQSFSQKFSEIKEKFAPSYSHKRSSSKKQRGMSAGDSLTVC